MPRVFRSMYHEAGIPVCGSGSCELGVRVPIDIAPDAAGQVRPAGKGMSVSASPDTLLRKLVPRRFRQFDPERFQGAAGDDELMLFERGEGSFASGPVSHSLTLHVDAHKPTHGVYTPQAPVALHQFQANLMATQPQWQEWLP